MAKEELLQIKGGTTSITSTALNALARVGDLIVEIGKMIGSSIRRVAEGKQCSV